MNRDEISQKVYSSRSTWEFVYPCTCVKGVFISKHVCSVCKTEYIVDDVFPSNCKIHSLTDYVKNGLVLQCLKCLEKMVVRKPQ